MFPFLLMWHPLNMTRHRLAATALVGLTLGLASATTQEPGKASRPTLYVVANAYLDTQWNWTVQDTIRDFVPATFFDNFKLIEQYPHYVFNFEGAIHYMWFKEYYPEAWATLQKHVATGRWRLAGSWINAVDVNVPSPESLMRQALYGKRFFRREFDRTSQDVFLPDCFGFGFALPSVAAHSGLTAFSTQKLTWGSSVPIPFPIGRWRGVDGSTVVAALNPRDYVTRIRSDVSTDPKWSDDLTTVSTGRQIGLRYFGVGDIGGAPDPETVDWLEKAFANKDAKIEVRNTSADQLSRDLTDQEKAALPEYTGELTMKTHGVGCYTSQAALKRFNRENELLADAAERAAVAARVLTGLRYPAERLRDAWTRVLWHQFHDDLTGTSIPQAYGFSWNDELVSANQFAGVLESSTAAVGDLLDTRGTGVSLVVFNPIARARRDTVEATVYFRGPAPEAIRVADTVTGRDVPAQVLERRGSEARVLFVAEMPPVGYKVFDVTPATAAAPSSSLRITSQSLENARYTVKVDSNGDIASVFDKSAGRELLRAPVRLELRDDPSPDKPAWRILWTTVNAAPREYPIAPVVRIIERGPVRVALEITRKAAGSTFVQRVMLTDGGDRVDVENLVDWKSPNTLLKASFRFQASNPKATYDLGLGTIERGNNTPDHYEVPAQKWADLTDASGQFGVAVVNDSKYGWDKPADDVLRLTLLHTAKAKAYPYESANDLGHHRFVYAIAGHAGDWRAGQVPARAAALNQPLLPFQTTAHPGVLGRSISLLSIDSADGQVAVRAFKRAEDDEAIVVRLQEQYGRPGRVRVTLPAGEIVAAREINAAEEPVGSFPSSGRSISVDLKPYQPRTFALTLQPSASAIESDRATRRIAAPVAVSLDLPFNLDGVSTDSNRGDGDFDGKKQTLAAELLPRELELDGVRFRFGSVQNGAANVLVPNGQRLTLPRGPYNRLYVLAASVDGDLPATFTIGRASASTPVRITIRDWQGPVGQWDSTLKEPRLFREKYVPPITRGQSWTLDAIAADMVVRWDTATGAVTGLDQIRPGFVKRDEIAWVGGHRHAPNGNQPYIPTYLFAYAIDLPDGARDVTLPSDGRVRLLAATVARVPAATRPAAPLYARDLPDPASAGRQRP
ncbi:MAG: glycosyl hydrolase-related protein [Acidobacteria bacterium]|nr:glycosyl hydrolase-related protein [Acidobacteriota bacterium]